MAINKIKFIVMSATPLPRKHINFSLEALRGFASLFVVWHHVQVFPYMLDPKYKLHGPFSYGPSGHFCVLLFFVLSGYVIGLSNKESLEWNTVGLYLKKRFIRLYPIFFVTLLLTLLTIPKSFSLISISQNIVLLQSVLGPDINPPSWSLHYEVLYYLLFIFISIFQLNPITCACLAFLIGISNYLLFPLIAAPVISSYSYGMVFWLLGLAMSRYLRQARQDDINVRVLLSCIFFILCIDQYNVFLTLMHRVTDALHTQLTFPTSLPWSQIAISFMDLAYLPFALLFVLLFTDKHIPHKLTILWIILASCALTFGYVAKHAYQGDLDWSKFALPTIFFIATWLILLIRSDWVEKAGRVLVLQIGVWLGSLSYGIYLIHVPLMFLFNRIKQFSGTPLTFSVRFLLLLLLTLSGSYFLEQILQPKIKLLLFKPIRL
ncbi:MAG: acyltransferase [Hymenobacter sp.]|nr:MAG: acyltransferase [Hymenobacter sp.]